MIELSKDQRAVIVQVHEIDHGHYISVDKIAAATGLSASRVKGASNGLRHLGLIFFAAHGREVSLTRAGAVVVGLLAEIAVSPEGEG